MTAVNIYSLAFKVFLVAGASACVLQPTLAKADIYDATGGFGKTRIYPTHQQSSPNWDRSERPHRHNHRRNHNPFNFFEIMRTIIPKPSQQPSQQPSAPSRRDLIKNAPPAEAIQRLEALYRDKFANYFGRSIVGSAPTVAQMAAGFAPGEAAVFPVAFDDQVHVSLVPSSRSQPLVQRSPQLIASAHLTSSLLTQAPNTQVIRKVPAQVNRDKILAVAQKFRREVSDPSKVNSQSYLQYAQQLYEWIIAPIEPELEANQVDTILFSMDDGLRSIPLAALHDGEQFLVEKYGIALIPSFGLTNTRPSQLQNRTILAMGISEETQGLSSLPSVPVELSVLAHYLWPGQSQATIDANTTLANLRAFNQQYRHGIIHLATHAQFKKGKVNNSYIQFWNERLTLDQLLPLSQELQWGAFPSVEMLVLSACQTALGSQEAELGFAGSAIAAGVPSSMASLWYVSDRGTLGLMIKFYQHLRREQTKSEAIRQAQLAMLSGEVKIQNGLLYLSEDMQVKLPESLANRGDRSFTHPYFWSGFTVIGNWDGDPSPVLPPSITSPDLSPIPDDDTF